MVDNQRILTIAVSCALCWQFPPQHCLPLTELQMDAWHVLGVSHIFHECLTLFFSE